MSQLQKRGVKFSVDDFGTGYSSLSVIHNMNIDFIKIDRSFINNIENKGRTIVQAVKDISESLNFDVIAEGVETEKQVAILKQCGVHFMQGYYFSPTTGTACGAGYSRRCAKTGADRLT
ncbi:putative signal transduction protein [Atlantibacter hermannii]|nr:putative signal transduction protein [Atlantibacter hermannii]